MRASIASAGQPSCNNNLHVRLAIMPIGTNHVDMRGRGPNPASDERGREPAVVRMKDGKFPRKRTGAVLSTLEQGLRRCGPMIELDPSVGPDRVRDSGTSLTV